MDCRDFIARHSELVDGALALDESVRLRQHAASCSACARYDHAVRRGGELVRELLPRVEASPDFEPRLRRRLLHARQHAGPSRSGLYLTLALLVAIGGALVVNEQPGAPVVQVPAVHAAPPALVGPATPVRMPSPATRSGAADVRWPVYSSADYAAEFGASIITPVMTAVRVSAVARTSALYPAGWSAGAIE